jgi:anti-sigma B factor antagonist
VVSDHSSRRPRHLTVVPDRVLPQPFGCTVYADGDAVAVAPSGELDIGTAPLLESALSYQRDLGAGAFVVDLRGVTFIDCAGVHLLLRWAEDAARGRHEFRVIPGSERVQRVLEMTSAVDALGLDPVTWS